MLIDKLMDQVGNKDYYVCMSEDWDVTYYSTKPSVKFNEQQVKVPLWFKKDADSKYVCYCNKVTEEEVINTVIKDGATNMQEILKNTGAMSNS